MPEAHKNPFEGVTDFFSELKRMREIGTHGYEHVNEDRDRTYARAWVPLTDIFARDDDLVIRIEVAGQRPEDVEITFSGGILTVSGQRWTEEDGGDVRFYIRERFHGAFRRAITLPPGTDDSQITAEFFNGLVEITVRDCVIGEEQRRIALTDRSSGSETRSLG